MTPHVPADMPSRERSRVRRSSWSLRLVLTASQKGALQAFFQENPYLGISAREHLDRELAITESRIQVCFQNQRTRQLRQSHQLGRVPKEGNRKWTSISASQTNILLQAFEEEWFPGIAMRESLAIRTGIPEARIQVSFTVYHWHCSLCKGRAQVAL
uniref:Homeobox domain-containing protein n=1 Tax=Canis lupus dingo TaxID=286419 RepID=A0A8C0LCC3_CANLU